MMQSSTWPYGATSGTGTTGVLVSLPHRQFRVTVRPLTQPRAESAPRGNEPRELA